MDRLRKMLEQQGLQPSDVPKAIILHELISIAMAAASWGVCYAVQPSKTCLRPVGSNAALTKVYKRGMLQAQRTISRLPFVRPSPGGDGSPAGRLTVSLAESIAIRAALKPLTIPFKIWASWKLTLLTKHHPSVLRRRVT